MTDIDSYLLKCTLEEMGNGKEPDQIVEECNCRYGYSSPEISQQLNNNINGEKNDN